MRENQKRKYFDGSFLALGLVIQLLTFYFAHGLQYVPPLAILSLISGCLGICSVCLTAQGNILTFVFGFGQIITYTYLCWTQRFYAEIAINIYYFATMIYGVFAWRKRLICNPSNANAQERTPVVRTRRMKWQVLMIIAVATLLLSWVVGSALATWTDDTQPYLDAFTTVPALVAQILMIMVYGEHWMIWLVVDIVSIALWLRAGDYCMTAQYAFWCCNCVYGWIRWRKLLAPSSDEANNN